MNTGLFDITPLPCWIYDLKTLKMLDVNQAGIDCYGYTKDAFLNCTIVDLCPNDGAQALLAAFANIHKQEGNILFGVFFQQKKSGALVRMKMNGRKVDFFAQKSAIVVCQDVSEEAHIIHQLKLSEQRLNAATAIAKLGYWRLELDANTLAWTDEIFNIWGRKKSEFDVTFKNFLNTIHPDDEAVFKREQLAAFAGEQELDFVHRIVLPDKSIRWVHELGRLLRDEDGKPLAFEGTVQDITARKTEEQRLKLLESVITNTNDAVLITEAEPFDEPGPRIIYVNEAFTKMTGYTAEEVIGKTPRILQGPNSDKAELARLGKALRNWESYQITTINYKKNGEEFWINFTVSPVSNDDGWFTHWIAIERDVTEQKQKELEKELLGKISLNFSAENDLSTAAREACRTISELGKFDLVELWAVNLEKSRLQLHAYHLDDRIDEVFYKPGGDSKTARRSEGLAGKVWDSKVQLLLTDVDAPVDFEKEDVAKNIGLNAVIGFPLLFNNEVVGVLVVGTKRGAGILKKHPKIFQKLEGFIGSEINRKKLENVLSHLYEAVPDILCLADFEGRFLKINNAGCALLGYSEKEILYHSVEEFVHPDDKDITSNEVRKLGTGETTVKFENRYLTKTGNIIWLSWSCNSALEEKLIFATAKNITEEKKLRELNRQANSLAKIGSWEIDLLQKKVYWSDMVHQLHETDAQTFLPDLSGAINFYREDFREMVQSCVEKCMLTGEVFDFEAILVSSRKTERWVRAIGNAEFANGQCRRIFGSFQDIEDRKGAEIRLQSLADNLPGVVFQYLLNPDGTDCLRYVTKGAAQIWGFSPEAVVENNKIVWHQIKEAGSFDVVKESLVTSIQNKTKWTANWKYVLPTGDIRTHLGYGTPNFLADGTVLFNSVILDITQEAKNEALLKQVTNMARIGSWELDIINQEGDAMYWSPMTKQILELDELYDPTLTRGFEFYAEVSKPYIQNAVGALIADGTEFDEELLLITATGKEKWIRCIGKSSRIHNRCVKIYGSFQDIHASKSMELQIREILGSISDAFYALDKDWKFTYFNREAEKLLLKNESEVIGKNIWEVFSAARGTLIEDVFYRVVETEKSESFDYLFPGDGRWYELNAYPSNGGVSAYFKNIDERKHAAEQLKSAFDERNAILESIGDAFFSVTKDWIVSYWNKEAENILGKNRDAIVGKYIWDEYKDAIDTDFYREYHKAMETQKNINFEAHYPTLNKWFEVSIYPSANGLSVYFKDVTLRKQADIRLQQANERFEKATEAANDAIWDWNILDDTFYRGSGFKNLFGYDVNKTTPTLHSWTNHIYPADLKEVQDSLLQFVSNATQQIWQKEYRYQRADGTFAFVADKGIIMRNKQGEAVRMVGAMTDISDRKKHEAALLELNDALKKHAHDLELTNEQLEQFAYIASHDLQEPLRMITSFLDQLKRKYAGQLDDKAHQYIHFATDGAKRMKQIILDLLEYSRAGKLIDSKEAVDMNKILEQYLILRRNVIAEKTVEITIGKLPVLQSYKAPLTQTFHCLLDNAIKYSKEGQPPRINLSATELNNSWMIRIEDNGIGIDQKFFEKIFIIFQRLHNKDIFSGNGIGLSIAKKHVESWVVKFGWNQNRDGEARFILPIQRKLISLNKYNMTPANILLVEDNEGDIMLTLDAFEESKIKTAISVVRNGQEAMDFLFRNGAYQNAIKPDLILLDINIPIFNGHEVLRQIKEDPDLKKIPVIMLTTSSNPKDINRAYENHSNSYVKKPLDMEDFLKAILKIEEFWLQLSTLAI